MLRIRCLESDARVGHFESDASNAGDGFSLGAKLELNDDHQSARPIVAAVGC